MNTALAPTVNDKSLLLLSDEKRQEIAAQIADATTAAQKLRDSAFDIEVVDSPDMLELAARELRRSTTTIKDLDERRLEITRPFDAAKAFVMDLFAGPKQLVAEGDKHLRGVVKVYTDEQDRLAAEARRLAEEQARKDRLAAQERAEAAQLEADHADAILEDAVRAAQLVAASAETTQAERVAAQERVQEAGQAQLEAAEAVEVATEEVEVATVTRLPVASAPAARGVGTRKSIKVQSIDLKALIMAIAGVDKLAREDLLVYVQADEQRISGVVRAMKEHTNIPGVTTGVESSLSVRRS